MAPVLWPASFQQLQSPLDFATWEKSFKVIAKDYMSLYTGNEQIRPQPQRPPMEKYIGHDWPTFRSDSMIYDILHREYVGQQNRITEARVLLWSALSEDVRAEINIDEDNIGPKDLMEAVTSGYKGLSARRTGPLWRKINTLRMDNLGCAQPYSPLCAYASAFIRLVEQLGEAGKVIDDEERMTVFLRGLSDDYATYAESITANKEFSMEWLVSELYNYDQRGS